MYSQDVQFNEKFKKNGKSLSDSSDDDYKLVIDMLSESEVEVESEETVKFRVSN